MIALITASYWDEEEHKMRDGYVAKSNCSSFVEAADYAESIYGKCLDVITIEILDTELYLNEEIFEGIRQDKFV